MRFRDGTLPQKALFTALLLVFVWGIGLNVLDKVERIGAPDAGFSLDDGYLSPTRRDASAAGVRGGGQAISINGEPITSEQSYVSEVPGIRLRAGETNHLVFVHATGEERALDLSVREWTWNDAVFTEGATDLIGVAFFVVGLVAFLLRPWQSDAWALYTLCSLSGGLLFSLLLPETTDLHVYQSVVYGFLSFSTIHLALAFPVVHPILRERPWILSVIYGAGVVKTVAGIASAYAQSEWGLSVSSGSGLWIFTVALIFGVGRSLVLSVRSADPVVRQRARILIAGMIFGLTPVVALQISRGLFHAVTVDSRFAYWALGIFLLALGRVTVRHDLMNARIAVRKAFIYTVAVAILTGLAIALSAERSYAVAVLLFPLLYFWPRFDAYLNQYLYPQRARFPELIREIGRDYADAAGVEEVLEVLAHAGQRLCDARSSVAFLLPDEASRGRIRSSGPVSPPSAETLADDALVRLMVAMRSEVSRDQVAVEPQFRNVQEECRASFVRLGAEILLPIVRDPHVVGGLAIGPRLAGDPYEREEIDAFNAVVLQATQALGRVEATERLRAREREFAELERFFPPQIIEQVIERRRRRAAEPAASRDGPFRRSTRLHRVLGPSRARGGDGDARAVPRGDGPAHRRVCGNRRALRRRRGDGLLQRSRGAARSRGARRQDGARRACRRTAAESRLDPEGLRDRRRHGHPYRLRDLRLHRLRGAARLRRHRQRDEPRRAPERRGAGGRDPRHVACPRRASQRRPRRARRRAVPEGLPAAADGVSPGRRDFPVELRGAPSRGDPYVRIWVPI